MKLLIEQHGLSQSHANSDEGYPDSITVSESCIDNSCSEINEQPRKSKIIDNNVLNQEVHEEETDTEFHNAIVSEKEVFTKATNTSLITW